METTEIYEKFDFNEIDDVRIIIKAKGRSWGIVAKDKSKKQQAQNTRLSILAFLLNDHVVITPALEDIKANKHEI